MAPETKALNYWRKNETADVGLNQLAAIVLALPITQVTVERAFSYLQLVITNRRNYLVAKIIDDIFMVKFNGSPMEEREQKWCFIWICQENRLYHKNTRIQIIQTKFKFESNKKYRENIFFRHPPVPRLRVTKESKRTERCPTRIFFPF